MLYLLISILLYSFFLLENETNTEVAFLFIPSLPYANMHWDFLMRITLKCAAMIKEVFSLLTLD